jgi:hypothetical protein
MSVTVRFRGAQYRAAILGTIRYSHVWDWTSGRVKDNTFDSLGKLGFFDSY